MKEATKSELQVGNYSLLKFTMELGKKFEVPDLEDQPQDKQAK